MNEIWQSAQMQYLFLFCTKSFNQEKYILQSQGRSFQRLLISLCKDCYKRILCKDCSKNQIRLA
jgi:hypothetical protein